MFLMACRALAIKSSKENMAEWIKQERSETDRDTQCRDRERERERNRDDRSKSGGKRRRQVKKNHKAT